MANITRMQLLRGDIQGKNKPFRPPWAIPEDYFVDYCTRCDKCIDACFDDLIVKGRGGYPQMDFTQGGCDFCEDCLNICEANALLKIIDNNNNIKAEQKDSENTEQRTLPPWHIKASIELNDCLSMNAVICRSCGEACEDEVIQFDLRLGGIAEPVLDREQCTGCGSCFSVCPIHIVDLKSAI